MPRKRHYIVSGKVAGKDVDNPGALLFARRLNDLMMKRGWQPIDLARAINQRKPPNTPDFSNRTVSAWLRGLNLPSRRFAQMAADAFDMSVDDLIPTGSGVLVGSPKSDNSLTMLRNGRSHLKLDCELPSKMALDILKMVNDETQKPKEP